ncbi:hypothetical protein A8709_20400 [Paenibacillus pectinilyticus]|uniref:NADH-quinone oxidoreductase subunit C n=1 Tax=Paenibacillus pectinilyticus TaxID=512399 RepID=A0A1C0ZYA5_9BACL|nr:NADH-quinone oxidoreductase subunit C [Paenibacillus pectinilyticus]OCT13111.1 hypothetical protein A8709_20400 [Paenibacillus pectinilyticus]
MSEEKKPEETVVPGSEGEGKAEDNAGTEVEGREASKEAALSEARAEDSAESEVEAAAESNGGNKAEVTSAERNGENNIEVRAENNSESKAEVPADSNGERKAEATEPPPPEAAPESGKPAPAGATTPASADAGSEDPAAKAQAAAEARAARAAARGAKTESADPAAPKEPSPNQPLLDRLVEILKAEAGEDAVVEAFINERDAHRPYVVIHSSRWPQAALTLRNHEELRCDYLRNLSGVDQETHLEVAYHLLSLTHKREYCVKVKTDREHPSIPSVAPVWPTADWNEREAFDLFGIDFPGHPNLVRIMMPDDWVGHPLRKDYEPLDPEV